MISRQPGGFFNRLLQEPKIDVVLVAVGLLRRDGRRRRKVEFERGEGGGSIKIDGGGRDRGEVECLFSSVGDWERREEKRIGIERETARCWGVSLTSNKGEGTTVATRARWRAVSADVDDDWSSEGDEGEEEEEGVGSDVRAPPP